MAVPNGTKPVPVIVSIRPPWDDPTALVDGLYGS